MNLFLRGVLITIPVVLALTATSPWAWPVATIAIASAWRITR